MKIRKNLFSILLPTTLILILIFIYIGKHDEKVTEPSRAGQSTGDSIELSYAPYKACKEHPFIFKADSFLTKEIYDSAIYYYGKAGDVFYKSETWAGYIYALSEIAYIHILNNQYDIAFSFIDSALQQGSPRLDPQHIVFSEIYRYLGLYYHYMNEPDSALSNHQKSLQVKLEIYGESHFEVVISYLEIGDVHRWLRLDYYNAEKNYYQALRILENLSMDNKKEFLYRCYYNLATTNRLKGDYDKAMSYGFQSLNLAGTLVRKELFTEYSNAIIANIYNDIGDYANAIQYFKGALAISLNREKSNRNAQAFYFNNLANVYTLAGNYNEAYEYSNKALQTLTIDNTNLNEIANSYNYIGNYFQTLDHFETALKNYANCVSYRMKYFGNKHNKTARAYYSMGELFQKYNQLDSALKYYQKSIISEVNEFYDNDIYINPVFDQAKNKAGINLMIHNKAVALRQKFIKNPADTPILKASMACYYLLDSLIYHSRHSIELEESKLFLSNNTHKIYEDAIECAYTLYQITKNKEYISTAFQFFEKTKYSLLLDKLAKAEAINKAGIPDSIKELERNLHFEMQFTKKRLSTEKEKPITDSLRVQQLNHKIFNINRKLEILNESLKEKYANYYDLKYQNNIAQLHDVFNYSTKNNSQIIQYFFGSSAIYAMSINQDSIQFLKFGKDHKFEIYLNTFMELLSGGNVTSLKTFKQYTQHAHYLYKTILEDLTTPSSGNTENIPRKLVIIPDGPLNQLAFEALISSIPDEENINYKRLEYLICNYHITYAYSANLLMRNATKRHPRHVHKLLGFSYSDKAPQITETKENHRIEKEIPGTFKEIKTIAKYVNGKFYTGNEATEHNFKTDAPNYNMIHLAIHGKADRKDNMDTKLIFTRSQDTIEDGMLFPYELYSMNLKAQLTVLSACETGVGKNYKGEGVFSMARAFMYAGCPSLVISLWEVNDLTTVELMNSFYKNISKGYELNKALNIAKLDYLKNADEYTAHPSNWASFIALGDMSTMKFISYKKYFILFFALILILSIAYYTLRNIYNHKRTR